jgi:t-SNARE complex subunit (syntaxin)
MKTLTANTDWIREERNYEMARLQAILRNPRATQEEIAIAINMLRGW